jgi:hypothetical protein
LVCLSGIVVGFSLIPISYAVIRYFCPIYKAIGAGREVVGLAGFVVLRRIVDWEALLLELVPDEGGALGHVSSLSHRRRDVVHTMPNAYRPHMFVRIEARKVLLQKGL